MESMGIYIGIVRRQIRVEIFSSFEIEILDTISNLSRYSRKLTIELKQSYPAPTAPANQFDDQVSLKP
jgi:hypothetical protein